MNLEEYYKDEILEEIDIIVYDQFKDTNEEIFKTEYRIQSKLRKIKNLDINILKEFKENLIKYDELSQDIDYCKEKIHDGNISKLLKWHYKVFLSFYVDYEYLEDIIQLILESVVLQPNEFYATEYLEFAFKLSENFNLKNDEIVKKAIWFIKNKEEYVYKCIPIITKYGKSQKNEIIEILITRTEMFAEQQKLTKLLAYVKNMDDLIKNDNQICDRLGKCFEIYADKSGETQFYKDALKYCKSKYDKERIYFKIQDVKESQIPIKPITFYSEIKNEHIFGNTNFERIKYLIYIFQDKLPFIEMTKNEATDSITGLMRSVNYYKISDDGLEKPYTNIDFEQYKEKFVQKVDYWVNTLVSSLYEYEIRGKITSKDYMQYITSFCLHDEIIIKLIELGILKHYEEDYVSSIHILIPQLENTLREFVIFKKTVNTKNVNTNQYKGFGDLLYGNEDIFDYRFLEMLKLKFIDKDSASSFNNLRNKICHGIHKDNYHLKGYNAFSIFSRGTSLLIILSILTLLMLTNH